MKTAATRSRKSEHLHILVDARFKRFLQAEAKRAGLSVAQLVRQRFEHEPNQEEAVLAALTAELNHQVERVSKAADRTIALADEALSEMRGGRERRESVHRLEARTNN
jgi:hypothetical protein